MSQASWADFYGCIKELSNTRNGYTWSYSFILSFSCPSLATGNSFLGKTHSFAYLFHIIPPNSHIPPRTPKASRTNPFSSQFSPCLSSKTRHSESYVFVLSHRPHRPTSTTAMDEPPELVYLQPLFSRISQRFPPQTPTAP